jgi:hypothetical protein
LCILDGIPAQVRVPGAKGRVSGGHGCWVHRVPRLACSLAVVGPK